jgi:hypothetical protein
MELLINFAIIEELIVLVKEKEKYIKIKNK